MPNPTIYIVPDFTLDIACSDDSTLEYSATLGDGISALPTFIYFEPTNNTFTISATSIVDVTVTPIEIMVTVTAPTG